MNGRLFKNSWTFSVFNAKQGQWCRCSSFHKSWSHQCTVYTALIYAQRESSKYNRNYCIVTFVQPLFIKAVDIIAASPEPSNVITRLGRFHLLMSFIATTGFVMAGRGFENLWQCVTHMSDQCWWSCILTCSAASNIHCTGNFIITLNVLVW